MENSFYFRDNQLYCEDISIQELASEYSTPAYIYSKNKILNQYRDFRAAFKDIPSLICFSVKSNSNISILKLLSDEGSGMDIISGGELFRTVKAGTDPQKIVYSGP
ncbi:MAG: diaminopimelate decarboxylase, partial [bacterium]